MKFSIRTLLKGLTYTGGQFTLEDQMVVETVFFSATGLLKARGSDWFEPVQQGSQNSEKF
jgi:hypothetical protein